MLVHKVPFFCVSIIISASSHDYALAILDDPLYVKALERRVACNEIINSWSSLTSAQEGMIIMFSQVPAWPNIALEIIILS